MHEMLARTDLWTREARAGKSTMSTFHARSALRILRTNIDRLGYKNNFESIYDEGDQLGVDQEDHHADFGLRGRKARDPISQRNAISKAKNNSWKAPETDETLLGAVFARYQAELKTLNAVDFDDLLLLAVKLLSEHAEIRDRWPPPVSLPHGR